MTYVTRVAGLALLAALLAACGGGGGGGSGGGDGGGSTAPPPGGGGSPPPVELHAIKLLPQGYQDSVEAAGSLIQLAMSVGQVAAVAFEVREASGNSAQYVEPCEQSGQISIDQVDNDGNQRLSAGDRLVMRYTNCVGGNATTNGVLNIDIAALAVEAARRSIDLRVSIESFTTQSEARTITITGGVNNLWTAAQNSDHFVISGTRLAISGVGLPERIENFTVDLTQDYATYEYRLSWRGDVASERLDGTFRFDTDTELLGRLGEYPQAGAWTIYGDNSAVRLEEGANGEAFGNEVGIVDDFDGDGVFGPAQVSLLWLTGFDMGMFDSFRPDVVLPEDLPDFNVARGREVLISQDYSDLADIVVDSGRDVLYASVPSSNEVVAVSTSTYHVVDRIPVGSAPKALYLPADRAELMVTLNRGGAVARLNPETRNFQRMETAVANNASAPETIVGAGDAVYVASFPSRTGQGVVPSYFARGSRATNVVERLPAIMPLARAPMELSVDGRYVFTIERDGNDTHFVKRDLSLPDTPVVASRVFTYALTERFRLNPDGQTLVLATGEVLRTSDFATIATIEGYDAIGFNEDGSRMLSTSAHSLILYDSQRYITLRTLWPDCVKSASQSKQVAYVAAHDQWVVKYDNKICAISIDDRLDPPGQEGSPAPPAPLQPVALPVTVQNVFTPLDQGGATIMAAEIDRQRGVLYLGGRRNMAGEVAVVSLTDLSTVATIPLPSIREPVSLALNDARDRLYVNQWGEGYRLEVVDTTSDSLAAPLVYPTDLFGAGYGLSDAKWIGNDRLLMTTNSNGELVTMVTLDTQTGTGMRIAGGEARFTPGLRLIVSADHASAFTNGFLNNGGSFVQRIDLTQPDPGVAMSRVNEELDGASFGTFSPGGDLLYFYGGIVVNPQTLMLAGFTGEGMQIPTPDGSTVYVLDTLRETLSVFDARTYQLRALYSIDGCFGQTVFAQLGINSRDIVWTAGAGVCRVTVP